MNTLKQQIKSGYALRAVRQAEALAGQTVSQHYSPGGFRLLSTPAVLHKRDRQDSKARARWMGLVRFFTPEAFHSGEYGLGF